LLTPAPNQHGTTTISLTVTDAAGASTNASFVLTVQPVNDPPLLGPLAELNLSANTSSGPLLVTLTDIDSDVALATLVATSSNPTLLPAGSLALAGAGANRTLTVTPATNQTGTALVRLNATDNGGASSSLLFRVNVSATTSPPIITAQPASRTVTAGATVPFTVVAGGPGPLSYQWRRDNQDLVGATNSTLTLINVQTSVAGSYTVVVRNSAGAVTSSAAQLRVVESPRITGLLRTSPNSVDVSFTTNPGADYVVEYQDGVDTANWTSLPGISGNGAVRTIADPTATGPVRFYRVRVE
jgi:hypothetical protein